MRSIRGARTDQGAVNELGAGVVSRAPNLPPVASSSVSTGVNRVWLPLSWNRSDSNLSSTTIDRNEEVNLMTPSEWYDNFRNHNAMVA